MDLNSQICEFLGGQTYAVAGVSRDRAKYGNKVLRALLQNGKTVYPLHPKETQIEGLACYRDLAALPTPIDSLSIVTPPAVTEQIVQQAAAAGVRHVWMQPGAESPRAVQLAQEHGMNVIAGGPCLLVSLHYHEEAPK